jgi:hypothetical protein
MNLHVVVEGAVGERFVYEKWIPFVNPQLSAVQNIFEIQNNNFAITAGGGFPSYFEVIENAIDDVNSANNIDRLVIAIDSEEMSFDEKFQEIQLFLENKPCTAQIRIIIQHFCLETWALGNKRIGPRNPKNETLRKYKEFFNILENDPELLPPYPPQDLNRSQFALRYLRRMLNDKNRNLTYTKNKPKALLHKTYFSEVKNRYETTDHIVSFLAFLNAFR